MCQTINRHRCDRLQRMQFRAILLKWLSVGVAVAVLSHRPAIDLHITTTETIWFRRIKSHCTRFKRRTIYSPLHIHSIWAQNTSISHLRPAGAAAHSGRFCVVVCICAFSRDNNKPRLSSRCLFADFIYSFFSWLMWRHASLLLAMANVALKQIEFLAHSAQANAIKMNGK